jgi:hypothetical protein
MGSIGPIGPMGVQTYSSGKTLLEMGKFFITNTNLDVINIFCDTDTVHSALIGVGRGKHEIGEEKK